MSWHWVTVTHIDTGKSKYALLTAENNPVFVYESFNSVNYVRSLEFTLNSMFPDKQSYMVHKAKISYTQVSVNDCGLFALAYAGALCSGIEPSLVRFDQATMRHEYNKFIKRNCKDYKVNAISNDLDAGQSEMIAYRISLSKLIT